MAASIDADKCSACGECVSACPLEAITVQEKSAVVDDGTCGDCGACVDVCPNEAISVS
jgi:ferredoxin